MSRFTVRVELRNATEDDYEKLRVEMEERGFSGLLPAGDGGASPLRLALRPKRSALRAAQGFAPAGAGRKNKAPRTAANPGRKTKEPRKGNTQNQ